MAEEVKLGKEASQEILAASRHYGAMRFSMMGAFFILVGLLINGHGKTGFENRTLALIGFGSAIWFLIFEFILSYNLVKLWTAFKGHVTPDFASAAPQRSSGVIWFSRATLPLPYLVGAGAWLNLAVQSCETYVLAGCVAIWIAMLCGWMLAERGDW